MSNFLTKITELFRYAKTYKLSTVTLKTPIMDFSFAPSTSLQPSYEGCFLSLSRTEQALHQIVLRR